MMGGDFGDGKGHATAYLSYLNSDPTTLSERDFSACQLGGNGLGTSCGGSSNSNYYKSHANEPGVLGFGRRTRSAWIGDRRARPRVFNSNPYMNLKHGRERYQAGVFADYDFNEQRRRSTPTSCSPRTRRETAVAPSGLFHGRPFRCTATTRC